MSINLSSCRDNNLDMSIKIWLLTWEDARQIEEVASPLVTLGLHGEGYLEKALSINLLLVLSISRETCVSRQAFIGKPVPFAPC
jgi:hypothetical protein